MTRLTFERATGCKMIDCSQTDSHPWLRAYCSGAMVAEVILRCKYSQAVYLLAEAVFHSNCKIVFKRQGFRCAECLERKPLEGDHIVPRARGVNHRVENIQGLCRECHAKKHGG